MKTNTKGNDDFLEEGCEYKNRKKENNMNPLSVSAIQFQSTSFTNNLIRLRRL